MRSIEMEGSTIDEAIAKALEVLRVDRDRVAVEILSNATAGLFGFGGRKARVRATIRESLTTALGDELADLRRDVAAVSRATPHPASAITPAPDARQVLTVLQEIFSHLGVTCTVEVREGPEAGMLSLAVRGDGSGLVIGRQGQTLDAIEYLLNRIAGTDGTRIALDVEGYRERREESLAQLARRTAAKVRQTGRAVALDPLSPRDRRIVHLTLQDDRGVVTRSEGEGRYRRVLILPQGGTGSVGPRGQSGRRG